MGVGEAYVDVELVRLTVDREMNSLNRDPLDQILNRFTG